MLRRRDFAMHTNAEAKLAALEIFDEIAEAVGQPNGITIKDGMAATGLSYHRFYAAALQLNVLGKVKFIRSGELRLIAAGAPCSEKARLFTRPSNTAGELRAFLRDVLTGIENGSVPVDLAETISLVATEQINQSLIAGVM